MTVKDGHDHTPVEEHHPSPLPPYLRQSSRTHSTSSVQTTSSTRSRPHAQNEYIPTSTGITTVFGTAEPTLETDIENRHIPESDEEEGGSDEGSELDWDAIRDQSTSDKPAWRRPRPAWIYPFMFGTAFTLGMSSAPKAELFINLTCLVHPPRQPSSVVTATLDVSSIDRSDGVYVDRYNELDVITQVPINASLPDTTLPSDPTIGGPIPRSAADKWFYKLQKDIYDWNLAHPDSHDHERPSHTSAATTSTASRELPTGPLPQPTLSPDRPAPPSTPPTKEPHQGSEHPPFHAIDPTLCKKDPGVQAAAAKLTMSAYTLLPLCEPSAEYSSHCDIGTSFGLDDGILGKDERQAWADQDFGDRRVRTLHQVSPVAIVHTSKMLIIQRACIHPCRYFPIPRSGRIQIPTHRSDL